MPGIIYFITYIFKVILCIFALILFYKIVFKKKKLSKLFSFIVALITVTGAIAVYDPPAQSGSSGLTTDVTFFCRTFGIQDERVYKTLLSNSYSYAPYELLFTVNNHFKGAVKIDEVCLTVNAYEEIDAEFISPEGGGGGESGYLFYYGSLEQERNVLTYLGNEYGNFNPGQSRENYVKIDSGDLEVLSVYFDCDKPGLYELSLQIQYSGEEKGEYTSDPVKLFIMPYEMEQERAKVLPMGAGGDVLQTLYDLSGENKKISRSDYAVLEKALVHPED